METLKIKVGVIRSKNICFGKYRDIQDPEARLQSIFMLLLLLCSSVFLLHFKNQKSTSLLKICIAAYSTVWCVDLWE